MGSYSKQAFWIEWQHPRKKKTIETYIEAETEAAAKRELSALLSPGHEIVGIKPAIKIEKLEKKK